MAEAILNKIGYPRFLGYSAGSHPTGRVNPLAIALLASMQYSTKTLRSKSWMEFTSVISPSLDMVITVCDRAAAESCPIWQGEPLKAYWSLPDPASVEGNHEVRLKAFTQVYQELERRIHYLLTLPIGPVDRWGIKAHLADIESRFESKVRGK
jgi:arsenate reductase